MKQYIIKCLKEKAIRLLIATTALMLLSQVLYAQEDYVFYLQKARQRIAEGDCTRAEASYNTYKDMAHKTNKEIERLIEVCKNGGSNALGGELPNVSGSANGHGWINLGLPSGTLWADCNIGARHREETGDYYAWGETKPKDFYGGNYCYSGKETILSSNSDAATINWGRNWRMPTEMEIEELVNVCYWEWHSNGYKVTGPNGNSIFLPAAGYRINDEICSVGVYGGYWTSSLFQLEPYICI